MPKNFPEQVPVFYRQLINWQDQEDCPLAKMVLANSAESQLVEGENDDPIGDHVDEVLPGLIHRYPRKVLLILTNQCVGHCRFCFRRASNFTQTEVTLDTVAIGNYLSSQPQVNEFILSGGDPLLVQTQKWLDLKKVLLASRQIEIVRWHSRLPVFNPYALTPARAQEFFNFSTEKQVILVIHINHPREISPAFIDLIKNLQRNFPQLILKSQSVLLKGVNADDPKIFIELFTQLKNLGVQPYRLYHLDQAPGISHFRVSIHQGLTVFRALEKTLPAATLPEYYLDLPAGKGKVLVTSLRKTAQANIYQALNHHQEKVFYHDLAT